MKGQKEKFEIYEQAIVEEQEQTVVATLTNDTVLRRTIPWDTMKSAKLISEGELAMIRKFDKRPAQEREDLLDKEGHEYAELFLNLLSNLTASDGVQYILAIIDELLHDERRIGLFLDLAEHNEALPFGPLLRLLNRNQDLFIYEKASKTVAVLLTKTRVYNDRDVQFFCRWITERLRGDVADVLVAVSALQILLRRREYRPIFHAEEGVKLLGAVLNDYTNKRQVLYQTLFCLWLLSYDETVAQDFGHISNLVSQLVEVIRKEDRVKIRRVGVATLRNILSKGENNEQMIKAGMVKLAAGLTQKKWKDEDIEQDLAVLNEVLEKDVNVLKVLSKMDGKVDIMNLMTNNPDTEVQKHALLCVQKMMVHNWEYLSNAN